MIRCAKVFIAVLAFPLALAAQVARPGIFLSKAEAADIRTNGKKYPLMSRTLAATVALMDSALSKPSDVPQPGDAAGRADERHAQNYREMQAAGELWLITGDARYPKFVRDMLEKYAVLYPALGANALAKDAVPGKLFRESVNEASWLLSAAIAYDCVYDWLKPAERARFEASLFRPVADWLSVAQAREFDRVNTNGAWAAAAVGMIGYAMGDSVYVKRALYGTRGNKTGGLITQLDQLFSPDGNHMEGPYYIRKALLPLFALADAAERMQPRLEIFTYRKETLKKALYAAVQTAYPNGVFPALNDATRTGSIDAPGVVLALDVAYKRYGTNENLLGAARIQGEVLLNGAGLAVARDVAAKTVAPAMSFGSVEFADGPNGDKGGLGILRSGKGENATMLLMKYGVHGEGHGHFDKLGYTLFDAGQEVVPDYGSSRWVNVEPKSGGRYLAENESYAMQTIAHNTLVVDQKSQSDGKHAEADKVSGDRNYFDAKDPSIQVMSARDMTSYFGVRQQRTMVLLRDVRLPRPVVVDVFWIASGALHTYDLPTHFRGQLIATNVPYEANAAQQAVLGAASGYQHIWKQAQAPSDSAVRLTWLAGAHYYSLTYAASPGTEVYFGRTGASDPNFNLLSEPLMLVRHRGRNTLFASVLEAHGYYSEAEERSVDASGMITGVSVLADTDEGSVLEITGKNDIKWTVMLSNREPSDTASHSITSRGQTWTWTGNFSVTGLSRGKP